MRIISEPEFAQAIRDKLANIGDARACVGIGRSGAIASVYASHILGIPYFPYGTPCPDHLRPLLIIDTATMSGASQRKAARRYTTGPGPYDGCLIVSVFHEPPRVAFWYEAVAFNKSTSAEPESESN